MFEESNNIPASSFFYCPKGTIKIVKFEITCLLYIYVSDTDTSWWTHYRELIKLNKGNPDHDSVLISHLNQSA